MYIDKGHISVYSWIAILVNSDTSSVERKGAIAVVLHGRSELLTYA